MSAARIAAQILERAAYLSEERCIAPILMLSNLAGSERTPGMIDGMHAHALAMRLTREASESESLTAWWGEGRTNAELVSLFRRAWDEAQMLILEEL